jgi:hypothetical protein
MRDRKVKEVKEVKERDMTESELDGVYTQLCYTMTDLGEARSPLFLARFALLAVTEIGDLATVQRLIADASEAMADAQLETAPSIIAPV